MSDSDLFSKSNTPYPLIGDILAKRPSTTRGSQSSETKEKGRIYRNRKVSNNKSSQQTPLIFWDFIFIFIFDIILDLKIELDFDKTIRYLSLLNEY